MVVVGSLNADLTVVTERLPRPGETVHGSPLVVAPGGKSANQAAAAARLGARVAMVGAVGQDAYGDLLRHGLEEASVDVQRVLRLPDVATGTAMITVDAAGENTIVISAGANGELTPDRLPPGLADLLQGAAVLCLSFEVPMETVVAAAGLAQEAGTQVLLNPSPAAPIPDLLLDAVDLLLLNESEAADLFGAGDDWAAMAVRLRQRGRATAVVTLGSAGAVVLEEGQVTSIPAVPITAVDTTGAGDAHSGVFLAGLGAGLTVGEAARRANAAAALTVTRAGAATSPTRAELDQFLGV